MLVNRRIQIGAFRLLFGCDNHNALVHMSKTSTISIVHISFQNRCRKKAYIGRVVLQKEIVVRKRKATEQIQRTRAKTSKGALLGESHAQQLQQEQSAILEESGEASSRQLTAVSLFCGAGVMDAGFTRAGFKIIWAADNNAAVCATYTRYAQQEIALRRDLGKEDFD